MKYEAILFDLDGTLMPTTNEDFEKVYLHSLAETLSEHLEPKFLLTSMWEALEIMVLDSSDATNEAVFYDAFEKRVGEDVFDTIEPMFEAYYLNEFEILKNVLDDNTKMAQTVKKLKDKGYRLIIATNPMFPEVAVTQRVLFSGLDPDDFDFMSNFTLHTQTKPNLGYYKEVLELNSLNGQECLMVGNDMEEDMIAKDLGMDAWLIEDYIINRTDKDLSDWRGTREQFYEKVEEELL
ncbi:MAG TPA: HAD family hydrolase [Erysipelothrix sp.]|nr:HAD family hydrolase [Erysipelothrix sp.]